MAEMTKEEIMMQGFEIVAYAGDARSKMLIALDKAAEGKFDEADALVKEADALILDAHKVQTSMIQKEAQGENIEVSFIMVHGQDHLMTAMLLKDTMKHLINMYRIKG